MKFRRDNHQQGRQMRFTTDPEDSGWFSTDISLCMGHSYYETTTGTCMCSIDWCLFPVSNTKTTIFATFGIGFHPGMANHPWKGRD